MFIKTIFLLSALFSYFPSQASSKSLQEEETNAIEISYEHLKVMALGAGSYGLFYALQLLAADPYDILGATEIGTVTALTPTSLTNSLLLTMISQNGKIHNKITARQLIAPLFVTLGAGSLLKIASSRLKAPDSDAQFYTDLIGSSLFNNAVFIVALGALYKRLNMPATRDEKEQIKKELAAIKKK